MSIEAPRRRPSKRISERISPQPRRELRRIKRELILSEQEEASKHTATEEDLALRRVDQIETYIKLESQGLLTPEWKQFGRKNSMEIENHEIKPSES